MGKPVVQLMDDRALEGSAVVANCRMNRERNLHGGGGYERELGFDPISFLEWRVRTRGSARWLDLCCGQGRALVAAAERFAGTGAAVVIHGVDLAGSFDAIPSEVGLTLESASVHGWQTTQRFDLITCVHGLHTIGDKLGLLQRAVGWLTTDGHLCAHLDLRNLKLADGGSAARWVPAALRQAGIQYDRRMVRCRGQSTAKLPFDYLGADPAAGPNYTGQPAVNSHYRLTTPAR
ncbi:MAG: SAM-dependent methyltransferase [Myxococcota bacterium]|jgi:SAM-dependent methyltransferase